MTDTNTPILPLVVVATPVYNGEAFLRETMQSVQAQTYPNLVHLVIDNASTDSTPEILAEFANATIPVNVVRHDTLLPQMENWNSAVTNRPEDAKWFRLLCADDLMMPDAVEKMVALGETDPEIGVVACLHDNNGEIEPAHWPTSQNVFDGRKALRRFFDNEGLIIAPHLLIRADALDQHTPFFDTYHNAADTDAALRTLCDWKMGFVHEHLAHTRVHEDTVTNVSVAPKKLYLFDWYLYLHRYAEAAYGPVEGAAMKRRYRRHYLRRMRRIRREGAPDSVWDTHKERLTKIGELPGPLSFMDAALDRAFIALKLRENWLPYPW